MVNSGKGNCCEICHQQFDEAGVCASGHIQGETYYHEGSSPQQAVNQTTRSAAVDKSSAASRSPVCQANGNRCTICGGYFADGDDICASGHEIGQQYPAFR